MPINIILACHIALIYVIFIMNNRDHFWELVVLGLLLVAVGIYKTSRPEPKPHSKWKQYSFNHIPDCKFLHAELLTVDGKKRVMWRKRPEEIDFSDCAKNVVVSYLVVE